MNQQLSNYKIARKKVVKSIFFLAALELLTLSAFVVAYLHVSSKLPETIRIDNVPYKRISSYSSYTSVISFDNRPHGYSVLIKTEYLLFDVIKKHLFGLLFPLYTYLLFKVFSFLQILSNKVESIRTNPMTIDMKFQNLQWYNGTLYFGIVSSILSIAGEFEVVAIGLGLSLKPFIGWAILPIVIGILAHIISWKNILASLPPTDTSLTDDK